jgi:hypothetical protein
MLFRQKNFEVGNSPSPGLFAAPDEYQELSLISYMYKTNRKISLNFEPRTGTG